MHEIVDDSAAGARFTTDPGQRPARTIRQSARPLIRAPSNALRQRFGSYFEPLPEFTSYCWCGYKRRHAGVQKETAVFHPLLGRVISPEFIGFHTGIEVVAPCVGEGGRAAATGFRVPARVAAGRHRVTDSPRPRQQARPGSSNRKSLRALCSPLAPGDRCLLLYPQQVSF